MKALILSGGAGTRLRPLTYTHAKQLLPIGNKPIIYYIIEKIARAGIDDIGIIVGDMREEVKRAVGNGDRWNVRITYIHQPLPLGLGHAVKTASEFIGESDFVMVLGDNLFSMELDTLIDNFYLGKANTSVLLYPVKDPSQFGVAAVKDGHITRLVEKPKVYLSDLAITGVYVFDKSVFSAIDNTKTSPRGELEITDAIQKQLETGGKVTYDVVKGWWKDTGSLNDLLEAHKLVLNEIGNDLNTPFDSSSVYTGKLHIGKNVTVRNSKIMGPAVIADNSVIINSSIGPYASIGAGVKISNCEIDNCIILEKTLIENIDKKISNSLIGKEAIIRSSEKKPCSTFLLIGDNCEMHI